MNNQLVCFLILLVGVCGCRQDYSPVQTPPSSAYTSPVHLSKTAQQVVESGNQFSFALFQETIRQQRNKTVFISPLSASMALAMACNGARGDTEQAMRSALGYTKLTQTELNLSCKTLYDVLTNLDPKVSLKIANAIWNDRTLTVLPEFMQVNKNYFNAEVSALDFRDPASVDIINNWCDRNTNGRIKSILDRLDRDVVLAILNALYFKGTWTYEFDKKQTRDDFFTTDDGGRTGCKMMRVTDSFSYFADSELTAVDLPYGQGHFSMTILLPKLGVDIDEFVGRCNGEQWAMWKKQLVKSSGTVEMPKLALEYEITMNEILIALGMGSAFSPGLADFSGISATDRLFISLVKQKTFLQVDEEGTEAAAVTAILFERSTAGSGSSGFFLRIDRPFIMLIRDHATDSILFIGKILKP